MKLIWSVWMLLQITSLSQTVGQTTSLTGSTTPPLPETTATTITTAQIVQTHTISRILPAQSTREALAISDTGSITIVSRLDETSTISSIPGSSSRITETPHESSLPLTSTSSSDATVSTSQASSSSSFSVASTAMPTYLKESSTQSLIISDSSERSEDSLSLSSSIHTMHMKKSSSSSEIQIGSSREILTNSLDILHTISTTAVESSIVSTVDSQFFSNSVTSSSIVSSALTDAKSISTDSSKMKMISSDISESIQTISATTTPISHLQDSSGVSLETTEQSSFYMEPSSLFAKTSSGSHGTRSMSETSQSVVDVSPTVGSVVSTSVYVQNSITTADTSEHQTSMSSISSVSVQDLNTNSSSVYIYSSPKASQTVTPISMYSDSVVSQSPKSNDFLSASAVDQTNVSSSVNSDSHVEQTLVSDKMSTVDILHSSFTSQSTTSGHQMTMYTASLPASQVFSTSVNVLSTKISTDPLESFSSISVITPSAIHSSSVYSSDESSSTYNIESNATQLLTSYHSQTISNERHVSTLTITQTPLITSAMTVSDEETIHSIIATYSGSYVPSYISSSEDIETRVYSVQGLISTVSEQSSPVSSYMSTTYSPKSLSESPSSLSTTFIATGITSSADHIQDSIDISTLSDIVNSSVFPTSTYATKVYTTPLATVSFTEQLESSVSLGSAQIISSTAQSFLENLTSSDFFTISPTSVMLSSISSQPMPVFSSQSTTFPETLHISPFSYSSISESTRSTENIPFSADSILLLTTTASLPTSLSADSVSGNVKPTVTVTTNSIVSNIQLTISTFSDSDMVQPSSSAIGTNVFQSTRVVDNSLSSTSDFLPKTLFTDSFNSAFDSASMEFSSLSVYQTSTIPSTNLLFSSSIENNFMSDTQSSFNSASRTDSISSLIPDSYQTTTATGSRSTESLSSIIYLETPTETVTSSTFYELSSRIVDEVSVSNTITSFGSYNPTYSMSMLSFSSREFASLFTSFSGDSLNSYSSHETIYLSSTISTSTTAQSFNESSVIRVQDSSGTTFQPDLNMTLDSIHESKTITATSMHFMSSIASVSKSTLTSTLYPSTNNGYLDSKYSLSTVKIKSTNSFGTDSSSLLTRHVLQTLTSIGVSYESSFKIASRLQTPAFNSISTPPLSSALFDKSSSVIENVTLSKSIDLSHISSTQDLEQTSVGLETLMTSKSDIISSGSVSVSTEKIFSNVDSSIIFFTENQLSPTFYTSLATHFPSALSSFVTDPTKSMITETRSSPTLHIFQTITTTISVSDGSPFTITSVPGIKRSSETISKTSPQSTKTALYSSYAGSIYDSPSITSTVILLNSNTIGEVTGHPTESMLVPVSNDLSPVSSRLNISNLVSTLVTVSKSEMTVSLFSSVESLSSHESLYPANTIKDTTHIHINNETPSISTRSSSSASVSFSVKMTDDPYSTFAPPRNSLTVTVIPFLSSTYSLHSTPMSKSLSDLRLLHSSVVDTLSSTKGGVSSPSSIVLLPTEITNTSSVLIGHSLISGSDRVSETKIPSSSTSFMTSREQVSTQASNTLVISATHIIEPGVLSSTSLSNSVIKFSSSRFSSNLKSEHLLTFSQSLSVQSEISSLFRTKSIRPSTTSSIFGSMPTSSKGLLVTKLGIIKSSSEVAASKTLSMNIQFSSTSSILFDESTTSTLLNSVIDPTKPISTGHAFQTHTITNSVSYEPSFTITRVSSFERGSDTFSKAVSLSPSTNLYSSYAASAFSDSSFSSDAILINIRTSGIVTRYFTESRSVNETQNLSVSTPTPNISVSVATPVTVFKSETTVSLISYSLLTSSSIASLSSSENIYPTSTLIKSTGTGDRIDKPSFKVRFSSSAIISQDVNMPDELYSSFVTASYLLTVTSISVFSPTDSLQSSLISQSLLDFSLTPPLSSSQYASLSSIRTYVVPSDSTVVLSTGVLGTSSVLIGNTLTSDSGRVSDTQLSLSTTSFTISHEQVSTQSLSTLVSSETYISATGVRSSLSFSESKLPTTSFISSLNNEQLHTSVQSLSIMSEISTVYPTKLSSIRLSITKNIEGSTPISSKGLLITTSGLAKSSSEVSASKTLSMNNQLSSTSSILFVVSTTSTLLNSVIDPTKPISTEHEFQTHTIINSVSYEPSFTITRVSSFQRGSVTFSKAVSLSPSTNSYSSYAGSVYSNSTISSTNALSNTITSGIVTGPFTESRSVNESPNLSFSTNTLNSLSVDTHFTMSKSEFTLSESMLMPSSIASLSSSGNTNPTNTITKSIVTSNIAESPSTSVKLSSSATISQDVHMSDNSYSSFVTVSNSYTVTSMPVSSPTYIFQSSLISQSVLDLSLTPSVSSSQFVFLSSSRTYVVSSDFPVVVSTGVLDTPSVLIGNTLISDSGLVSGTQIPLSTTSFTISREHVSIETSGTLLISETYISATGVRSSLSFSESKLPTTSFISSLNNEQLLTSVQSLSIMSEISTFYPTKISSIRLSISSNILGSMSLSSKGLFITTSGLEKSSSEVAASKTLSMNNQLSLSSSILFVESATSTLLNSVIDPTKPISTEHEFQTHTIINSVSYEPSFTITRVSSFQRGSVTFSKAVSLSPSTNSYSSYAGSVYSNSTISSTNVLSNTRTSGIVTGYFTESRSVNESPNLSFSTNTLNSIVSVDTQFAMSKSEFTLSESMLMPSSITSLSSSGNINLTNTITKSTLTSSKAETTSTSVKLSSSATISQDVHMSDISYSSFVTESHSYTVTSMPVSSPTDSLQSSLISQSVLDLSLTRSLSSSLFVSIRSTSTSSVPSYTKVVLPTKVVSTSSVLIGNSVISDSGLVSETYISLISTSISASGELVPTQRMSTLISSDNSISVPFVKSSMSHSEISLLLTSSSSTLYQTKFSSTRLSTASSKLDSVSTSSKDLLRTTLSLIKSSSGVAALTSVSTDKQISISELTSSFEASPSTPSALFSESSIPRASSTSTGPSTFMHSTDSKFTEMTISYSLSTINTQVLIETSEMIDAYSTSVIGSRSAASVSTMSSLDTSPPIMTVTSMSSFQPSMLTTVTQSTLMSTSELAVTRTTYFTSTSFYTQDRTSSSVYMTLNMDTSSISEFGSGSIITASPFLSLETSSHTMAPVISASVSQESVTTTPSVSSEEIITSPSSEYSSVHAKDVTETKSLQTSVISATRSISSGLVDSTLYMSSQDTPSLTTIATTLSSKIVPTSVSESNVIPSIRSSVVIASSFTTMRTVSLQPSSDVSILSANLTSTSSGLENITMNRTQILTTVSSSVLDLLSVNVTSAPTSVVVSSTLVMSNTRVAPTTSTPPESTTMNATASEEPYWVRTVLKIRTDVSITSATFKADLEKRLATAYDVAFTREKLIKEGKFEPLRRRRKKRYTAVGDAAVHLHEVSRDQGTTSVSAVYSVEKDGRVLTAAEAVAALDVLDTQEVAIILQQVLKTKAETYIQSERPQDPDDTGSKLWLIAAILGPVVAFVIFIWIVLCIYFKCCRQKTTEYDEPRLTGITESPRRVKDLSNVQEPRPQPDKQLPRQSSKSSLKPKVRAYEVTSPKEPDVIPEEHKTQGAPATPSRGPVPAKPVQTGGVNKSPPPGNSLAPPKPKRGKRNRRNSIEPLAQNPVLEAVSQTGQPDEKSQLLHSSLSDDNEELQERARIERRRNKDRLREKRRKERGDDPRVSEYVTSQIHLNNLGLPSTSLPSVYVESGSPVKEPTISRQDSGVYNGHVSAEENLEEARNRMHSLLDQAFSLISPRASLTENDVRHKKQLSTLSTISPKTSGAKQDSGQESKMSVAQDPERGKDLKHEPMYVNPMHSTSYSDFPLETWSPYRASDQVALISMPQRLEPEPIRLGQKKSDNRPASSKHGKRPAANFDFSESKSTSALTDAKYTTSPAKPIVLKTKDLQNTSADSGTKSNRQYSATGINGDVYLTGSTTSLSAPKTKPNTESLEMKSYRNSFAKKHKAPSKDSRNSDEVDVVNSLKPGENSGKLFQSLRDELSMLKESYKPETKPNRRRRSSTRPMTEIV